MELLIAVWIGLIVFVLGYNLYWYIKSKNSPVLTEHAEVLYKRSNFHSHGVGKIKHHSHDYYVTFLMDNGTKLTTRVKSAEYKKISKGDTGHLTHQGNWYVEFVPYGSGSEE